MSRKAETEAAMNGAGNVRESLDKEKESFCFGAKPPAAPVRRQTQPRRFLMRGGEITNIVFALSLFVWLTLARNLSTTADPPLTRARTRSSPKRYR